MRFNNLPNILSAIRGLLAPVVLIAIVLNWWQIAFVVFVYAVVSDLLDGPIARRTHQTSTFGGKLDHSADAAFVFCALLGLSIQAEMPLFLCIVQLASFLTYMMDSLRPRVPLKPSRLGKFNGISYFVIAGIPLTQHSFDISIFVQPLITLFAYALIVSTFISMFIRYFAISRSRRSRSRTKGSQ